MTAALLDREQADFDDQDVWLEMRNGPHGEFYNALGAAALRGDMCNRLMIAATWSDMFAQCEAIVQARHAELNNESSG